MPQIGETCSLLILDNHSEIPVEGLLNSALPLDALRYIEVVRHPANIGAGANILRCFELCSTEWVWILGDDNPPLPDAVQVVTRHIELHSECRFIHFASELSRRERAFHTTGTREFVDEMGSFGGAIFLSSAVYRVADIRPFLRFGYISIFTSTAHWVTLLMSLGEGGHCFFSTEQIVHWESPPIDQWWSQINFGLGVMTMLDLPMDRALRRKLALTILPQVRSPVHWLERFTYMAIESGDRESARYLYDQVCSRLYYFAPSHTRKFVTRLQIPLLRVGLRFPHLSFRLLQWTRARLAREPYREPLPSRRYARL